MELGFGTMLPLSPSSSVLWLMLFWFVSPCFSVCTECFGDAVGCSGVAESCPWKVGIAANVAAAIGTGAALIKLDKLLPPRYLRVFPRPVLQRLGLIATKPKGGSSFDPSGKTPMQIYDAVAGGHFPQDDGMRTINSRLEDAENDTKPDEVKIKQLERALTMVQKCKVKVSSSEVSEGTFLFVLAKLSNVTCFDSGSFDLCVEISESDEDGPSTTKRFSASLKRPKSIEQMYALLHQFQLVVVTAGLANLLAMGPFLEDVVYDQVRTNTLDWPTAFELLIIYLRMVENDPISYRIGNVVSKSGAMDTRTAEAYNMARGLYPAAFFRGRRGEPRDVIDNKSVAGKGGEYKGKIKGDTSSSTKGCTAWNLGGPHLAKFVDASGICRFKHACDQFVTDKGPGGQCLGDHRRKDCTYDEGKKCSKAAKE